jgi:WD40 repeat protein
VFNEALHARDIEAVAWSPDSRLIATGSWDNTAQVVDLAAHKPSFRFSDKSYVSYVAWSPDGRLLATAGLTNIVRVFDTISGAELRTMPGHRNAITGLAWSPDGSQIASTDNGYTVRLWDVAQGKAVQVLDNRGYDANVLWSPDGSQVASGADGIVRVWEAANGQLHELRGHDRGSRIVIVAWSADGKQLVTLGAYDHTLRIWDVAAQQATTVIKVSFAEALRHALF